MGLKNPNKVSLVIIFGFLMGSPAVTILFGSTGIIKYDHGGAVGYSIITGSMPPASGDWIINQNTTMADHQLVMNGTIQVLPSYTLEVLDSNITFSNNADGVWINGGQLILGNASVTHFNEIGAENGATLELMGTRLQDFDRAINAMDSTNLSIRDSLVTNGMIGISVHDFTGALIENTSFIAIENQSIAASFGTNLMVVGNHMIAGGNTYDCVGVDAGSVDTLDLINNTILNYHKSLFYQNVSNATVISNYFAQEPDSPYLDGELQFDTGCMSILLENNTISNLTYDGIEIYRSKDFLIRNNTIRDTGAGTHIEHAPIENITIFNNNFINSDALAKDASNINVLNNSFDDGTIRFQNCTGGMIMDNIICGPQLELRDSSGFTVANNSYPCKDRYPSIPGMLPACILASIACCVACIVFWRHKEILAPPNIH